jgi:putative ABC transport system permease protein
MLGRGLANVLDVKLGDRVTLLVSLPGGGISAVEGHVLGLFTTGVKAYDDRAVRMPIVLGRELLRIRGAHVWVVALASIDYDPANTMSYLKARLPADRFELATWLELADFYRKAVVLLSRQIDVMGLMIGLIIVLGISNTLAMNVLERTGEIGTLMAMGTPRGSILRLFVLEGVLLGIFGGLAGLAFGCLLAQALSYVGIPMPPPPGRDVGFSAQIMLTTPLLLSGFAMAVVSATFASLYPAWKAARRPIVDALRQNR